MITFRTGKMAIAVLLAIVAGCSREQQDWRSAEGADSIQAYDHFIQRHPDSELATQARARLAQLAEDRDWQRAGSADTADAYRQFLAQHPNGKWAQEARIRVENFSLGGIASGEVSLPSAQPAGSPSTQAAATGAATPSGTPASSSAHPALPATPLDTPTPAAASATPAIPEQQSMASATPSARRAAARPTRLASESAASFSGFGVQLGAFSSEDKATSEWHRLMSHFGPQLHGLAPHVVSATTASGHLYRLQAHVPDEVRARAICDALRKQSQACVPVLPH